MAFLLKGIRLFANWIPTKPLQVEVLYAILTNNWHNPARFLKLFQLIRVFIRMFVNKIMKEVDWSAAILSKTYVSQQMKILKIELGLKYHACQWH